MKKSLNILILLILTLSAFGQSIKRLENELWTLRDSEEEGGKMKKALRLHKKDPFNKSAILYICSYSKDKKAVSIFFDNLIKKYPNRVEPYLIRSDYIRLEYDYFDRKNYKTWEIKYLNDALKIEPSSEHIFYLLAKAYYDDFIYPLKNFNRSSSFFIADSDINSSSDKSEKKIKISAFEHSADSALNYFYKLWTMNSESKDVIYFPIRQLEYYLDRKDKSPIKEDILLNDYCFFPSWYFANLSENWESDTTIDYLYKIGSSKEFSAEFPTSHLICMEETCLYNRPLEENDIVFRFTWLRSFHHPICIRVEKNENNTILHWKIGQGAGGYTPVGLKTIGTRELSENELNEFSTIFNNTNFNTLPNQRKMPQTDGASWILEHKTGENYKAHQTNRPNHEVKELCLYLLKLTNIEIDEKTIY